MRRQCLIRIDFKCTYVQMKIVIDASVIIAVVLGEPERDWAFDVTRGSEANAKDEGIPGCVDQFVEARLGEPVLETETG